MGKIPRILPIFSLCMLTVPIKKALIAMECKSFILVWNPFFLKGQQGQHELYINNNALIILSIAI